MDTTNIQESDRIELIGLEINLCGGSDAANTTPPDWSGVKAAYFIKAHRDGVLVFAIRIDGTVEYGGGLDDDGKKAGVEQFARWLAGSVQAKDPTNV